MQDMQQQEEVQRSRRRGSASLSGTSAKIAAFAAVIVLPALAVFFLDWDKTVNFVLLRQDEVMRDLSNQALILFFWLAGTIWWYTYMVRSHVVYKDSIKGKVMWLTPFTFSAIMLGWLAATARHTILNSEIGQEALGATFAVSLPWMILFFLGLEWSSRRA